MEQPRKYPSLAETRDRLVRERTAAARACARSALQALADRGIEACVVGSLARGTFGAGSDVDFLIFTSTTGSSKLRLAAEIDRHFSGSEIPVDVVFSDDLDAAAMERITRNRLGAGDLVST